MPAHPRGPTRPAALAAAAPLLVWLGLVAVLPGALRSQEAASEEIEYAPIRPLAVRSLLLDGVVIGDRMVAVGERGHVLVSRDDGHTWKQARVPTRASLTGVFFHDETLGWAVGHDAVILRTRDGGETWERLHWAPEEERPFLDVWFRDAENGFAIGAYGYFLKTGDGGDTWEEFDIGAEAELSEEDDYYGYGIEYHLNHIARSGSGRLYIAAEAGTIYRSDDDGETWSTLPSPYEGSFFGTLPLPDEALLLYGLRGNLFRSDDGGESWQELASGTQALLTDGLRLADGTVVVAGMAGTLLVSVDIGRTFRLVQQQDRQGLTTVLPAADGSLVLLGELGANRLPAEALGVATEP